MPFLAEAAHFLRSPAKFLEAVRRGLLISNFDMQTAAPRLAQLVAKYANRPMDLADACLVLFERRHEGLQGYHDSTKKTLHLPAAWPGSYSAHCPGLKANR